MYFCCISRNISNDILYNGNINNCTKTSITSNYTVHIWGHFLCCAKLHLIASFTVMHNIICRYDIWTRSYFTSFVFVLDFTFHNLNMFLINFVNVHNLQISLITQLGNIVHLCFNTMIPNAKKLCHSWLTFNQKMASYIYGIYQVFSLTRIIFLRPPP